MSGNKGIVKIALEVDDKGSVKVLKQVGDTSKKAGKEGKESFDKMDKGATKFSGSAKKAATAVVGIGAGIAGVLALRAGIDALVSATKEYVAAAGVQEAAEADLEAVLKATGHAAGYNLDQLKAMANDMQSVTTVSDEVTLSGMAILATFKQVRGEAFERTSKAALDMSQVMKQDLKSSMTMLGKAVNDPITGLSALGEVGVTFTEDQKEMIKVMQLSGDIMGAQNIILSELESEFGGAAEAAAKTFAGGLTQAGNALGDVKEELGFVITKNQFMVELTHLATEEFSSWCGQISQNREFLMRMTKDGVVGLVKGVELGIETLRFFHNGWLGIRLVGTAAVQGLAIALDELNPMMRKLMTPIDKIFEGLVKIGALDVNPFDSLEQGLETFSASSGDVTMQVLADIDKTNLRYDSWGDKIEGLRQKIETIPVTQIEADKQIHDSTSKNLKDLERLQNKYADRVMDNQDDMADSMAMSQRRAWLAIDRASTDGVKEAIRNFEKQKQEAQRTAAAIATAMASMYKDIGLRGEENYQYQLGLLTAQADKYRTMGVDNLLVERWFTEEHRKLKEEQTLDSDNFFAGVRLGLEDVQRNMTTWADAGKDITQSMTSEMSSAFSDTLFAAVKGDISSMSSIWESAMDAMLKKLIDTAAQMVIEWAATQLLSFGSTALDWLIAEEGVWNVDATSIGKLYPDAKGTPGVPAVVHDGEMVVPADVAESIRRSVEGSGISGFAELGISAGAGPSGTGTLGTFEKAFLQNMGLHGVKVVGAATALKAGGYDVSGSDVVGAMTNAEAIMGAAMGALSTAINEELGMRSDIWGRTGQILGSKVGAFLGGPVGNLLGGVIGGTGGMLAGDALDARSYEEFRDIWESNLQSKRGLIQGWFAAQGMMAPGIAAIEAAHGQDSIYGSIDLNDPIGYDTDYGSSGDGLSESGSGYDSTDRESDPFGGMGGYARGGVITRLMVPRGEDGWAPVQFDEGVVSKPGMKALERLNSGDIQTYDMQAVVREIRALRAELKMGSHPLVKAAIKTAKYTETSVRRQTA